MESCGSYEDVLRVKGAIYEIGSVGFAALWLSPVANSDVTSDIKCYSTIRLHRK